MYKTVNIIILALFIFCSFFSSSYAQREEDMREKNDKNKFTIKPNHPARIQISYRADGEGKGAFYDHYTVQLSTKHETLLIKSPETPETLHSFIKQQTFNLPYGREDQETLKKLPFVEERWNPNAGMLFIPGSARGKDDSNRETFELESIRQARLHGQPILAVCAGSWRLWQAYGGKTKEVKDHNYNGGMLRLNEQGVVTYNVPVHDVRVETQTLLSRMMHKDPEKALTLSVNSVHWLAPNETEGPLLSANKQKQDEIQALYKSLKISGRSVANEQISLKSRQGEEMEPEEETVEAFETIAGAPIVGIQWHPEAYCRYLIKGKKGLYHHSSHRGILEFMAKAGDAYATRRQMVGEFREFLKAPKNTKAPISKPLRKILAKNLSIK